MPVAAMVNSSAQARSSFLVGTRKFEPISVPAVPQPGHRFSSLPPYLWMSCHQSCGSRLMTSVNSAIVRGRAIGTVSRLSTDEVGVRMMDDMGVRIKSETDEAGDDSDDDGRRRWGKSLFAWLSPSSDRTLIFSS